jgi:hypothetical protein
MTLIPVNLATEDELSEVVLFRVLAEIKRFAIGTAYRRGGFGYLRRTINGWNRAAKGIPFIVLTDLDDAECPARLIGNWLRENKHPNLLFRIAVHEIESWLLADPAGLSEFFTIKDELIPPNPDAIKDPKATIVRIAQKSRSREVRERIVPRRGSTAKQGPDYNGCLGLFVSNRWNVEAARGNSLSLARTIDRLTSFQPISL